jgi:multidrug resistance efflux pump
MLVLGTGVRAPARVRRPLRRIGRLKAQIAAQEHELLRRQNTALGLARDVSSLRSALEAARGEGRRLERELSRVGALRASEVEQTRTLVEAVRDQQAAVRELERATAAVLGAQR